MGSTARSAQHVGVGRWLRRVAIALALPLLAVACTPLLEPAGPAITAPHMTDKGFVMRDGAVLPLRRWLPEGKPRAVILALHGFNDYSKAFDRAGPFWAARGIATYAYDQRGFGKAPNHGIWAGYPTMVADAQEAASLLRRAYPDTRLVLLGDSMGGAVAMLTGPVADATVLVAPAVWGRRYIGWLGRTALRVAYAVLPGWKLTGQGLGIKPSDNIEMLRALGRDPLVIKRTRVDTVKGLVDLMDAAFAAAPEIPTPALYLYGTKDELVPPAPVHDAMRALPKGVRIALYRNGYHMLLRDLDADVPLGDIAAWIADPAAPLPSGADRTARRALAKH